MKLNIVQAIGMALMQEMEKDDSVVVLGEDVGIDGGVFRATDGLIKKFPRRVIDTPLAESGIVGISIGMAVYGLKPVAEIQFDGFTYSALAQIINHAGRIRTRSRGKYHCPFVMRFPYSAGIHAPEHHSESPEAYFVHTPGIKVVVPSTPYDTKGLLVSAIRDPDPVIFMEPKKLYRAIKQDVPEEEYIIPLGEASVVQEGDDVTVISYGAMMKSVKEAAKGCEIIDVRTLSPLDTMTIEKSVKKTGRVVVVHEAPRQCGFAAEMVAQINERIFLGLEAPVVRVTGFDVPTPLAKLENYFLPDTKRIQEAIEKVKEF